MLQLSLGPCQVGVPALLRGGLLAQQLPKVVLSSGQLLLKALEPLHKVARLPHVLGLAQVQASFCYDVSGACTIHGGQQHRSVAV